MNSILFTACLVLLPAALRAFEPRAELETIRLAELKNMALSEGAGAPAPLPGKHPGNELREAYNSLEELFTNYEDIPENWDASGEWEGRVFQEGAGGGWRVFPLTVSFYKTLFPADLGPLFPGQTSELRAVFPYYAISVEERVSVSSHEMKLQFRPDKQYEMTFRRFQRGGEEFFSMRTNCYGNTAYGYFFRKKAGK